MHRLKRQSAVAACLVLALSACTSTSTTPLTSTPSSSLTSAEPTVSTPPSYRYTVFDFEALPPVRFGRSSLEWSSTIWPKNQTWTPRPDPLAGRSVEPEVCRNVIRTGGLISSFTEWVPSDTPGADAQTGMSTPVDGQYPFTGATIANLTGEAADRYIDRYSKTPAECANILVGGTERAAVVERSLPGFGARSRYLTRSYPLAGGRWTERILLYRTSTYLMDIRQLGPGGSGAGFQAFARQVRDLVQANLKST
ncbi:hypothetical protein ACFV9C_04535 [Kribbella sp. NPDC059898]|uniref:hypothetical protein n=1 Tax=Kribbella sp. NPDC059898 TaxID=3346995 RepID=UPI00365BAA44